jgi:hypothetical protein
MELFLFWIVGAFIVGVIATNKGRSGFGWFLLSLIVSPILTGILVLVMASKVAGAAAPKLEDGTGRKCPSCAEIVRAEAVKCRFCGTDLPPQPKEEIWA